MKVYLVGMGMGAVDCLTERARRALAQADAIIGSERLLRVLPPEVAGERFSLALPEQVAECVRAHPQWRVVCVALSGDPGFYSGARKLFDLLGEFDPEAICGIASHQYLAGKLRRSWQDFRLVSAHGVACDILAEVLNHPCVFFLTGGETTVESIIAQLCDAGLGAAAVSVGENLSSPDERIRTGTADSLREASFAPLSVALVENDQTFARAPGPAGIADDAFVRGDSPMTKREVRAAALALMDIRPDSVVYDIGAGTGSIAVECALQARRGRVYAVEERADACDLILANRRCFGAFNMQIIHASAPEALVHPPAPDSVYIGGSRGVLAAIVAALVRKNPAVRIVVGAVTLETLAQAGKALEDNGVADIETVQVAITRTRTAGSHTLFAAQNPVFLISGGGRV